MSREDAVDLLDTIQVGIDTGNGRVPKIGTVQAVVVGAARVLFDGEATTGAKLIPHASSYSPKTGHRVVVIPVGSKTSWLILCSIGRNDGDVLVVGGGGYVAQSPNGTFWRLTPTDSGATSWTVV